MSTVKTCVKSNLKAIGAMDGGRPATPPNVVRPIGRPMSVVPRMPSSRAPRTLRMSNVPVSTRPMMESSPGPEVMFPSVTNVAELEAMTPPFFSPMKAM